MPPDASESACFPSPAQTLLMRAALLDGEPARAAFRSWRAEADVEALDGESHRLIPLLSRNLGRLGVADPCSERWRGVYRSVFAQNALLFHDMRAALEALEAAGIPAIVLKGTAIVATLGASGARPMADLDALVPPERAGDAFAALRRAGWRSVARRPERLVGVRHGTAWKSPSGRELDLHWYLVWENCFAGADAPLWARAREVRLGTTPVRVPAPEDIILHACVHGMQSAGGTAIRWASDVFLVAQGCAAALDWERLASEAARRRVALTVRTALRWTRERIDAPIPDAALGRLDALPVDEAERAELAAKLRPMRGLSSLTVFWSYHRRATEGARLGALGRIARFAPFLQRSLEIEHPMELPYYLIYRGLRHIGMSAGLVRDAVARPARPARDRSAAS